MPIRFIDRAQTNIVRVAAALGHATSSFIGTFTAPATRTGAITAQLQDFAGALSGVVQANSNRVGSIATTLQNFTAAFLSSQAAQADWIARRSAPGVVWWHGFDTVAELNAFRWMNGVGNDPNATGPSAANARILVGEGPGGSNCLEFIYPAGTSQPTTLWWRPTAPLNTGSGKAQNDPAANGTLTVRTWNPTSSTSHTSNFTFGWYGNALYANADPTHFDGTEFYFQIRVKADPRRITGGNEASEFGGGKFVWFTTAEGAQSLSGGEHVTWSYGRGGSAANQGADKNYVRVYVHQVTGIGPFDPLDQEEPGTRIQPGSDSADDWYYSNGWDTLLYHVRPGQVGVTSGANASRLRIYAAHEGETSYTKIWDQEYGIDSYEARNGLQAVILSAYNNSFDFPQEFFHRYAQPIFSKEFIPCPATAPTWASSMSLNAWGPLGTDTFTRVGAANIGQNGTGNFSMVFRAWNGAAVINYGAHKSVGLHGGGHQDYYGNEFYLFDLSTLMYQRMTNPSLANGGSWAGPFTNGILSDGTPNVPHTYNFQCGRGSTFVLGKRQVTNTPSSVNMISVFDPAVAQATGSAPLAWTNSIANPGISPTAYDGMCYDSTRDLAWLVQSGGGNFGWASYNFSTDTWTPYSQPTGNFSEPGVGPVYVAGKDMVLCFVNASNTLLGMDPASPTTNPVTLTRTGTPPPVVSRGSGACWSSNLNAVVYWHENSNTIHLLTPPAGDWRTGTWTWSQRSVTGTSGNHTGNGAFNKFQVVEWGAITVAVLFDDHANPPRGVRLS